MYLFFGQIHEFAITAYECHNHLNYRIWGYQSHQSHYAVYSDDKIRRENHLVMEFVF